jgi:hypothetical protein
MKRNITTLSEGCHYCESLILFIVILKIPLDFWFLFAIISLLRLYF